MASNSFSHFDVRSDSDDLNITEKNSESSASHFLTSSASHHQKGKKEKVKIFSKSKKEEKSKVKEEDLKKLKEEAKNLGIQWQAVEMAERLFSSYKNVSDLHAKQIALLYCKFCKESKDDHNDDNSKRNEEKGNAGKKMCLARLCSKCCSFRHPLFGSAGLERVDDFDIVEDKECCCGRILYRTHRRIDNYMMYLNHHSMEYLSMKLLIELANMKHHLAYRIYSRFTSNKALLILTMLLMPIFVFLALMVAKDFQKFVESDFKDIYYRMDAFKNFLLLLNIAIFFIFAFCCYSSQMAFRSHSFFSLFYALSSAILFFLLAKSFLKNSSFSSLKAAYRSEQFRQAFWHYDQHIRAKAMVDRVQRQMQCCGIEGFQDYFEDSNFEKSQKKLEELEKKGNYQKKFAESPENGDPKIMRDLMKKKIPRSCFRSSNALAKYLMLNTTDIQDFGYRDSCIMKIMKHTKSHGLLNNSQQLILLTFVSLLLTILGSYVLYQEQNRLILIYSIAETIRRSDVDDNNGAATNSKFLDANAEAFRMYNASQEAPGCLDEYLEPHLRDLRSKLEETEQIMRILKI